MSPRVGNTRYQVLSVSQNPTWRPQGHWCYLIVFHVREEVASFLWFLLGI